MVEMNLDSEALKTVVATAILEQLTPEKRDDLIKQAVVHLIDPPEKERGYGARETKTPLQAAFDHAAAGIARDVIQEFLAKDSQTRAKIEAVVQKGILKAFEERAVETSDAIASAVVRVFNAP